MVYMSIDGDEIISTSPETLVKLQNGVLNTFPIAGSRPRGKTDTEDNALADELIHDERSLQSIICSLTSDETTSEKSPNLIRLRLQNIRRFSAIQR